MQRFNTVPGAPVFTGSTQLHITYTFFSTRTNSSIFPNVTFKFIVSLWASNRADIFFLSIIKPDISDGTEWSVCMSKYRSMWWFFFSILYWCDGRSNIIYPILNPLTASSLHPLIRIISVPASLFAEMILTYFFRVEIMSVVFCHDILCFNPLVLRCN